MYSCHLHFYLSGHKCRVFELIKEIQPLEFFTHEFNESEGCDKEAAGKADVILANLQDADARETLRILSDSMSEKAELIVILDKEQLPEIEDALSKIKDVWTMPMSDAEIGFRILRWQQTCKMSKDYWQTGNYLESTINSVPNLIWYKDKNGIHEKVNDSFCKTVNKTKAQVEGQGHAYIWDVEQDDPACIESERIVMSTGQTCVSEEIVKTGEGERQLTTYKSPLYNIDGSVMGTVGVAIDVTKERIYEKEIVEKNRALETIFTTMDCGVICHTVDGSQITSVNKAALRILGYDSQSELMEEGFDMIADSVMDEDKAGLRENIKKLKNEGDNVSVEYRIQHKNGEILHVMGNVKLVEENGQLIYQRFLLDCTVQKEREQKVQQEKDRHQKELVQALSIDYNLVCFFDLDTGSGIVLRIGEESRHLFGSAFSGKLSLEKSMSKYIDEFVYEDDRDDLRQASTIDNLKSIVAEKKTFYTNFRICIDGDIIYFQMKVVRVREEDGSYGIVLGFRSVDEEIRSEMEKKSMLEDALLQANRANKAKSVFLSNMSHDIRTPMNAIVGFTDLALSHIDNKDQVEEYLKKITTSGNHLLSLINDILDMSRIESGKMQLDEKQCSLPDILHGLRNILQADIRAKQLELSMDVIDLVNEDIYCDRLRLNQILLNLLGNSVKFTRAGGSISIRIIEKAGAPAGYSNYEFHVKDTGIGMSKEFVEHIFEPFERERTSTISGIQGSGLGMAITKNIVDMMNGTISVKSEKNAGTEFIVSLTFRLYSGEKEPQSIPEWEGSEGDAAAKEDEKLRTGRILLVEDNELNQEIAVAILTDAGYTVEVAGNGQIALDMLNESKAGYYQVILMDVQMPVMGGYEATRHIRSLENKELASIPIIAMTADAFEEDRQEAIKSGMNDHITKPIDVNKLFEALDKILL